MTESPQIYIIGAGISGLIAAYELEQAGYTPIIFEKSNAAGGRVRTVHVDGYDLDIGFQVLLSAYPLAKKYLDYDQLQLTKLASGAQVLVGGKQLLIGDPQRDLSVLLPTLFSSIGSLADKLKILGLNRKLKKKSITEIFDTPETSTLEYLQSYGFSQKVIDRFFKPFFSGIFLEPDLRTSSRMFEFVYKMFGEGDATIPAAGIGAISEQLVSKLTRTEIHFNKEVERLTQEHVHLSDGTSIPHDGVIVTSNASDLVQNLNEGPTRWKSCMCLYFKIDKTTIPQGTISLVADGGRLSNNAYAYRTEDGTLLLSITTLKYRDRNQSEVIAEVENELSTYFGVQKSTFIHSFTIEQALPDLEQLQMSGEPSSSQLTENIFLAGDLLYNGSLNAAMESGRLAALGLIEKQSGILK